MNAYTCKFCSHITNLNDDEDWGKKLACPNCGKMLADNLDKPEPRRGVASKPVMQFKRAGRRPLKPGESSLLVKDEPAFPVADSDGISEYPGLTVHDYFAGKALQGLLSTITSDGYDKNELAKECFHLATAMMLRRNRP